MMSIKELNDQYLETGRRIIVKSGRLYGLMGESNWC